MSDMWVFNDPLPTGQEGRDPGFTGYKVEATDGSVGEVAEAASTEGKSYLVVDTGAWLFSKKVVLPAGVVERVDEDDKKVYVDRTKDEIKDAPEFDEARYADAAYHHELGEYYAK